MANFIADAKSFPAIGGKGYTGSQLSGMAAVLG